MTRAHDFIQSLPKGYDTEILECGNSLSGGQRQLISITRALLSDRPIWIFDEATSALDVHAEREIMKLIKQKDGGRTLLMITHRLTAIQDLDNIILMDQGRIVQQGSYFDLVKDTENNVYQELSGGMRHA